MAEITPTGHQKIAIIFQTLGQNLALSVFKDLKEDEIQKVRKEMESLEKFSLSVRKKIVEEFYFEFLSDKFKSDDTNQPFEFLQHLSEDQIFYLLRNEPVRVIAIAIAQVDVKKQYRVVKMFTPEEQAKIMVTVGDPGDLPYEGMLSIAADLREKSHALPPDVSYEKGGSENLAKMIDLMGMRAGQQFFERLQKENPDLAKEVKKHHLQFEDLKYLPDEELREVFKGVEARDIALSLKGQLKDLVDKIISVQPEKVRMILEDEMDLVSGPQLRRVVESAQNTILSRLREMSEEGKLNLEDYLEGDFIE
ncbi:MAG: hypothetical protein ISS00_00240 [Candidatus Marinimicrobia bacterium]|nr:hypothetical protein [Candidatus Neomarinimicrobiota bacterium]